MSWIESPPRWLARLAVLAAGIGLMLAFSSGARAADTPVSIAIGGQGSVIEFVSGPYGGHDTNLNCHRLGATQTGVCSESVPPHTNVALQAIPAPGYTFVGWSVLGEAFTPYGCGQQVVCIAHVHDTSVTFYAQFDPVSNSFLTVLKIGSAAAQGVVSSVPAGILCGLDCTDAYPSTSTVTLTAAAPSGVTFGGWGGDCAAYGSVPTCTLTMAAGRSVTATFNAATFPLTVTIVGQGKVASLTDAGIACPTVCAHAYPSSSQVVLHDEASKGWKFTGWSGAGCTGTVPCTVTMNQAQSVTATFARASVDAHVVNHKITYLDSGLRQLRVGIDPDEVVTVTLQIRRDGALLQQKIVPNVAAAPLVNLYMNISQGISQGKATLKVIFENQAGTQKVVTHNLKIPAKHTLT